MAKYILKNKDIDILSFDVVMKEVVSVLSKDIDLNQKIENINILKPEFLPINLNLNNIDVNFHLWIMDRKVPENREFVENIVATYSENGKEQLMDYLDISLGLSLNDSFWVVPKNKDYKWKDFNLYQNTFSEALERAAFGEELHKIQGFTSSPEYTTKGMLKKCWHRENDKIYLYKGSSKQYANSGKEAFSEFYMAQIADIMGFDYVPYDLKEFHGQIVSSCPIFTNENEGYAPMYKIFKTDDWKILQKAEFINAIAKFYDIKKLRDLMLFDALILNPDRHCGNFGMIIDNNTNKLLRPAPIFDNGFSMINFLTIDELKDIKNAKIEKISSFGYTFDEQMKEAVQPRHIPNLRKLAEFEFVKHPKFNLSDEWIKPVQAHIQERANLAINLCKERFFERVENFNKQKSILFPQAREKRQKELIKECESLKKQGIEFSDKQMKAINSLCKIQGKGR